MAGLGVTAWAGAKAMEAYSPGAKEARRAAGEAEIVAGSAARRVVVVAMMARYGAATVARYGAATVARGVVAMAVLSDLSSRSRMGLAFQVMGGASTPVRASHP